MHGHTTAGGKTQGVHQPLPRMVAIFLGAWGPACWLAVAAEPLAAPEAADTVTSEKEAAPPLITSGYFGDFGARSTPTRDVGGPRNDLADWLCQSPSWDRPFRFTLVRDDAPLPAPHADAKDWEFIVAPYVWAAGINGDVTVRGRTASVDASFTDVLQDSDSIIGIEGYVEVRKGRLGAYVDGTYVKIGVDDVLPGRLEASLTNELALVDFGAMYRLGPWDLPGKRPAGAYVPTVAFDAIVGGRYTYLATELDFDRGPSLDKSGNWVYPLVGGRVVFDVTQNLQLLVRGDVGGVAVDDADSAWSATGLLGYKFKLFGVDTALYLGYRALDQNLKHGSGRQEFEFDATLHGPILGIAFRF